VKGWYSLFVLAWCVYKDNIGEGKLHRCKVLSITIIEDVAIDKVLSHPNNKRKTQTLQASPLVNYTEYRH
jgi:hypothetical protein